jgi:Putative NADP-dependent oxidoreductases
MTIISKYVALKNYIPTGLPKEDDFEIKSKTLELDETNNIHVLNSWISVDPYMRARMTERKNYKPPFLLGEEMEGYAIGSVQKSKDSEFKEGDIVFSNFGMRDNNVCKRKDLKIIKNSDLPFKLSRLNVAGYF